MTANYSHYTRARSEKWKKRAGKSVFRKERSSRNMAGNNVKFSTQADNVKESEKPKSIS